MYQAFPACGTPDRTMPHRRAFELICFRGLRGYPASKQILDYVLVLDFESTCWDDGDSGHYFQEISTSQSPEWSDYLAATLGKISTFTCTMNAYVSIEHLLRHSFSPFRYSGFSGHVCLNTAAVAVGDQCAAAIRKYCYNGKAPRVFDYILSLFRYSGTVSDRMPQRLM
jgi:hypothetical protein